MSKLVAFKTYERFRSALDNDSINEHALNFIIDTGLLYTHGFYLNSTSFGAASNGSVTLTVAGITNTLSLSSHTHSDYLEKNSDIDIGSCKIVSGNNTILLYSNNTINIGDTLIPTCIKGPAYVDNNTILDTGNFSIEKKTISGNIYENVALFTYGSSKFQLDYVKRLNTSSVFDNLHSYTCLGSTHIDLNYYGFITFYASEGVLNSPWALLRINMNTKALEYRTSNSTTWTSVSTPTIPNNALDVAGIVAAPSSETSGKVWKTDNLGNPDWRDEKSYNFYNLKFLQVAESDLMTYNSQATKTILAGDNIAFSYEDNVLTIRALDTTYNVFTGASAQNNGSSGLVTAPSSGDENKFLKGDGTWAVPTDLNTWRGIYVDDVSKLNTGTNTKPINFKSSGGITLSFTVAGANDDYNTLQISSTTYSNFTAATSSAAGSAGLVPAPQAATYNETNYYLRSDGTWVALGSNAFSSTAYLPTGGGTMSGSIFFSQHGDDTYTKSGIWAKANVGLEVETPRKTNSSDAEILPFNVKTRGGLYAPLYAANIYSNGTKVSVDGHTHSYLPLSGGTLTGALTVKQYIFGYNYNHAGSNAPAFVFDKPGSNYTGIGANGEADTIYFSAATFSNGEASWVTSYKQKWKFNGTVTSDTFYGSLEGNCTGSAGSVAWTNVSSKPETATRWPAWSEVTEKPESFSPSSHTHNYIKHTGKTENECIPEVVDSFQSFRCTNSTTGFGDGYIMAQRWSGENYITQLFTEVDASYALCYRYRDSGGTWGAWKRVPMGDGTGASGTWGIGITGNAGTATKLLDSNKNTNTITASYYSGGYTSSPAYLTAWNGYHLTYCEPKYVTGIGSAAKLATSRSIWGLSFDGTGDITGHLKLGGYLYMQFGGEWLSTIDNDGNGPIFGHLLAAKNRRAYYVGSPVYICGGSYGSYASGITVNSSNNVGIGTTSPSLKLDVNGIVNCTGLFVINDSSNTTYDGLVYFRHYSNNDWGVIIDKNNAYSYGLDIRCNGDYGLKCSGHARFANNVYAANFYTTSDRLKKQNISSLSEHIRKFQLKDTEKWHYGVIALEVPEMFREGEEGDMTVNYNSVLSYYIGCLENRVKELEEEVNKLKNNG